MASCPAATPSPGKPRDTLRLVQGDDSVEIPGVHALDEQPSEILGLRRRTAARGVFRLIHRSRIALRGATRFARGLSR